MEKRLGSGLVEWFSADPSCVFVGEHLWRIAAVILCPTLKYGAISK